jgi:anti-sigma factor RsiW
LYQHLSICPACRTELAGHLALASAVTRAMAALRDPPEGLAQAVLAQLPGAGTTDERGRKQAAPGLVFVRFLLDSVKSPGLPGLALDSFQWALSTAAGI